MSDFDLRAARSTDAGQVGAILSDWIDETPWMPRLHTRAEDIGFAGQMIDRGWVTVAEKAGRIAGFGARDGAYVHSLYVAAETRGAGCGRALLGAMQGAVGDLTLWTFQANKDAQRFYEAHGFVEAERTDGQGNDEKLPDIRYEWRRKEAS